MSLTDEWVAATRTFARQLAAEAAAINAVSAGDRAALRGSGQALLRTLVDGFPLLSNCEVMSVVESFGLAATKIDPEAGERLGPVRDLSNQLMSLTRGGLGPTIWAQEQNGLPDLLKEIPLPDRERRVVDNMLWTRDLFKSSTKALEGVSEEIERQDGSGERKAKEAAREVERTAANPPGTQSFFQRLANAVASLFRVFTG